MTAIPLANGLPLPKAGFMAERQGIAVARAIAAELGSQGPPEPFDGAGVCPIELGLRSGAVVEGRWYAEPEPVVAVTGPSPELASGKETFEAERLSAWFGA